MQINVTGHHLEVTNALNDHITSKLERLGRHFDVTSQVHVILTVEKQRHKAEVTLHVLGKDFFAEAETDDLYAAVESMADKLDRQLIRHKEKISEHRK